MAKRGDGVLQRAASHSGIRGDAGRRREANAGCQHCRHRQRAAERGRFSAAGASRWASMRCSWARSPSTRRTIRRGWAWPSIGMRPIPSFHPIPPGYGLPWGRAEEEFIPSTLVREAEFALAREQLKTQTPEIPPEGEPRGMFRTAAHQAAADEPLPPPKSEQPTPPVPPTDMAAVTKLAISRAGSTQAAGRLARSAGVHPAAAGARASSPRSAARADHDAHADLSRTGRKVYRAAGDVFLLARRRPLRRLARLSGASGGFRPLLLLFARDGNVGSERRGG